MSNQSKTNVSNSFLCLCLRFVKRTKRQFSFSCGVIVQSGFITVRYSSYRNIMFSQASVILSTGGMHGRGHVWQGGLCGKGACMAGDTYVVGGACVVGVCMVRGAYMAWVHAWQEGMHVSGGRGGMRCRRDGHCSGRYVSYWNAFLCWNIFSCTCVVLTWTAQSCRRSAYWPGCIPQSLSSHGTRTTDGSLRHSIRYR